jgi:hypothetical protein
MATVDKARPIRASSLHPKAMAFRFAHDARLESPLAALAQRDSLLAELIEAATLAALVEARE